MFFAKNNIPEKSQKFGTGKMTMAIFQRATSFWTLEHHNP